jgi:hypothetical protein
MDLDTRSSVAIRCSVISFTMWTVRAGFAEDVGVWAVLGVEQTNAAHVPRLLSLGGKWRKQETQSENDREPAQPHGHLGEGWLAGV